MHQCHSSRMSGNMSPNTFHQLSRETCSASPYNTTLCSACILGGANDSSTLPWGEWLSILRSLGLSERGCQRQLSRTGLRGRQAAPSRDRSLFRFLTLCPLDSRAGNPTKVSAKYSSFFCLDTSLLSCCENQKEAML